MQIFLFYVQIAFTAWFVDSIHFLENSTSLCMEFYLREIRVLCQSLQNGRIDILFALRGTLEINFDAEFDYIPYCKCRKLYMKFFSAKTIENWFCMRRGYRLWLTSMLSNTLFLFYLWSIGICCTPLKHVFIVHCAWKLDQICHWWTNLCSDITPCPII